jgi:hypothetical protein
MPSAGLILEASILGGSAVCTFFLFCTQILYRHCIASPDDPYIASASSISPAMQWVGTFCSALMIIFWFDEVALDSGASDVRTLMTSNVTAGLFFVVALYVFDSLQRSALPDRIAREYGLQHGTALDPFSLSIDLPSHTDTSSATRRMYSMQQRRQLGRIKSLTRLLVVLTLLIANIFGILYTFWERSRVLTGIFLLWTGIAFLFVTVFANVGVNRVREQLRGRMTQLDALDPRYSALEGALGKVTRFQAIANVCLGAALLFQFAFGGHEIVVGGVEEEEEYDHLPASRLITVSTQTLSLILILWWSWYPISCDDRVHRSDISTEPMLSDYLDE